METVHERDGRGRSGDDVSPAASRQPTNALLEWAAQRSLTSVATALAGVMALFVPVPVLRVGRAGLWLSIFTVLCLLLILAVRHAAERERVSAEHTHAFLGACAGLLIVRNLVAWWIFGGEIETGLIGITLMAVGLVCLSTPWMWGLLGGTLAAWLAILLVVGHPSPSVGLVVFLWAAPLVAYSLRRARVRSLMREEEYRIRDEQHREQLMHVSRLATAGALAAEFAHEVNQPLAAVSNCAAACTRLQADGSLSAEKLAESLAFISAQALRAGQITRRLREFLAQKAPSWEPVDVAELLRDVLQLLEPGIRQRQLVVDLGIAEDVPLVRADRLGIQQVIVNLIVNAMEALADASGEHVRLAMRRCGEDVEVSVSDHGCGLGDRAEKIFDPFFTTKAGGLGMGLAISRSIVERHGGKLWATQTADNGTTFQFTLPIKA